MPSIEKKYILDAERAKMKMKRMAYEILENNNEMDELVLAGIAGNGKILAETMAEMIKEVSGRTVQQVLVHLDKQQPMVVSITPELEVTGKVVILVDDVTNSGRTLTYALKPLLNSFAKKIQTLVLVERSHTKFPVKANYVGLSLSTFLHEHIFVEVDGKKITGAYVA